MILLRIAFIAELQLLVKYAKEDIERLWITFALKIWTHVTEQYLIVFIVRTNQTVKYAKKDSTLMPVNALIQIAQD